MVDPGNLEILVQAVPGTGFVGLELRALGDAGLDEAAAWLSLLKTAGTELPPRSRTMTTHWRLPFWLLDQGGGRGGSL